MNYTKDQLEQWNSIVNILRNEMPAVSFMTWIKPLKLIAVTSDTVVVLCENQPSFMHLTTRYGNMIDRIVKAVFGNNYSAKLVASSPDDASLPSEN